jgi:hypothetical protein
MKAEFFWPGIAVWRWRKHGLDVWATGVSLTAPDWWHWGIGLRLLDFDFDRGMHFTAFVPLWIRLGPWEFDIYIEDRR